jgi:hypothetical protein
LSAGKSHATITTSINFRPHINPQKIYENWVRFVKRVRTLQHIVGHYRTPELHTLSRMFFDYCLANSTA